MFSTVTALPGRVRGELVAGTFERFVVSPFGAAAGVVALSVFPLLVALASGTLTIAFAAGVFGMPLRWETAALSLPVALLGCLAFAPLAILATALVVVAKQAEGGVGFITMGVSFVGGFLFPVALLPAWIQWTSEVQPVTPTLELLRYVLVGTPLDGSPWTAALKIAAAAGPANARVDLAPRCRDPEESAARDDHGVLMIVANAIGRSSILDAQVRLPAHVVYRAFALETVVVNLERGVYHGLNPTGGRMLEALTRSRTVRDAVASLAEELGRTPAEIASYLSSFCTDLLQRGLIEVAR